MRPPPCNCPSHVLTSRLAWFLSAAPGTWGALVPWFLWASPSSVSWPPHPQPLLFGDSGPSRPSLCRFLSSWALSASHLAQNRQVCPLAVYLLPATTSPSVPWMAGLAGRLLTLHQTCLSRAEPALARPAGQRRVLPRLSLALDTLGDQWARARASMTRTIGPGVSPASLCCPFPHLSGSEDGSSTETRCKVGIRRRGQTRGRAVCALLLARPQATGVPGTRGSVSE